MGREGRREGWWEGRGGRGLVREERRDGRKVERWDGEAGKERAGEESKGKGEWE